MDFERYSIDVKRAMDDLYIGPQARILELINDFNFKYSKGDHQKLGVTPKFRWKPGSYDKVKAIITNHVLDWDRRANGMLSLFDRERSYNKNRLRTELTEIERILYSLRSQGRTFLTNTDEIAETFNVFRNIS